MIQNPHYLQIPFQKNIHLNYDSSNGDMIFSGPLGSVKCSLKNSYIHHTDHLLVLNSKFISPQSIQSIQHLNLGLTIGFRKKIFQSGIWTIMKKNHNLLKFKFI